MDYNNTTRTHKCSERDIQNARWVVEHPPADGELVSSYYLRCKQSLHRPDVAYEGPIITKARHREIVLLAGFVVVVRGGKKTWVYNGRSFSNTL